MESGTSIWVNPKIRADKQKYELLRMFLLNLYGAINAENKVLLLFNVPVSAAPAVEAYLVRNNLFADEPPPLLIIFRLPEMHFMVGHGFPGHHQSVTRGLLNPL